MCHGSFIGSIGEIGPQLWINLVSTTRGFKSWLPASLVRICLFPQRIGLAMGGSNTKEKPKEKEKRDQARILKAISHAIETNAVRLDLNNRHIRELPETIEGQKTALKWLSLSHNELRALPDGVCLFVNLSALRLNGNQLSVLPQALSSLSALQVLDLSKNKFTDWDPTITLMPQLTDLNLQCNQIGSVRPPCPISLFCLHLLLLASLLGQYAIYLYIMLRIAILANSTSSSSCNLLFSDFLNFGSSGPILPSTSIFYLLLTSFGFLLVLYQFSCAQNMLVACKLGCSFCA